MKKTIPRLSIFFIIIGFHVPAMTETLSAKLPELQYLSYRLDTVKIDSSIIYSSDSAKIISPEIRSSLNGTSVLIEIVPRCATDSVIILVRHSEHQTDTLIHCSKPPFRVDWNYAALADQDQIHLQFGYILFHSNGKKIISKPLPHNWAIDRNLKRSRKKCHAQQILPPDSIIIDGVLNEWRHAPRVKLGKTGSFSVKWSDKVLYFAAMIKSSGISATDCIELHLDPLQTRSTFTDERHRSVRFSPMSRSYCLVSHKKNDSTYSQCDSIAVLLSDGMKWRVAMSDTGYIIEAALPFYALSDLEFPLLAFGFDVSCQSGTSFISWAGSSSFNRYNPSEWGTIILHQAMLPLKIAAIIFGLIFGVLCIVVVVKWLFHLFASERIEKEELRGGSPVVQQIQSFVDQQITESDLSIDAVAGLCGVTQVEIEKILGTELECSFDQFLDYRRIVRAKRELWNVSVSIEQIAQKCGYLSVNEMNAKFDQYLHTTPAQYRIYVNEMTEHTDEAVRCRDTNSPPVTITT